ncbi:MAG: phosphoglycerate kinase [Candidatus Bathyarchaeia archaeon]
MNPFLTMDDFDFKDKTVLVRVDFNSPLDPETKRILDDTRIRRHARTLEELSEKGAKVVVMAHQGRPGSPDFSTLEQHAQVLAEILGKRVEYVDDIFGDKAKDAIRGLRSGEILILENVRAWKDERAKKKAEEHAESDLVQNLAPLADIYINDAFAAAHRAHASLVGFTPVLPSAAGRVMERELDALGRVARAEERPCVYVLGGAKADDAAAITDYVLTKGTADYVLTGGVIANLFLHAAGHNLGDRNIKYLEKEELIQFVPKIQELLKRFDGKILLPEDLAVEAEGRREEIALKDLPTEHPIYDIGSETIKAYSRLLMKAKIVVLNGPVGVYENDEFLAGTDGVFGAVARKDVFSVAGGGHTVSAIEKLGLTEKFSYISTGGGALMRFLMGKVLPCVEALERAAARA